MTPARGPKQREEAEAEAARKKERKGAFVVVLPSASWHNASWHKPPALASTFASFCLGGAEQEVFSIGHLLIGQRTVFLERSSAGSRAELANSKAGCAVHRG